MTDWIDAIANRAGVARQDVAAVHAEFGILPSPLLPVPSQILIRRVQFAGVKSLGSTTQPFDFDWQLTPGAWAIVTDDANLRGKSSILEIIRWAIRGRSGLQADVRSWIRSARVELAVGDAEVIVAIDSDGGATTGKLSLEGGGLLAAFASDAEFETAMEEFMLGRLGLQRLAFFQRDQGSMTGSRQTLGWPALSEALYIHSTDNLLGDTFMAGLPGRLLQVYLGIPWAATLAAAKAADADIAATIRQRTSQSTAARAADALQRRTLQEQLEQLRAQLLAMPDPTEQLERRRLAITALAAADEQFNVAHARVLALTAERDEAAAAEIEDQRALMDAQETGQLRRFFNGLDPKICPRCDVAVPRVRKDREANEGHCALCGEGVSQQQDAERQELLRSSIAQLGEARAAAEGSIAEAEFERERISSEREQAVEAVRAAQAIPDDAERRRVEIGVARALGRLEELDRILAVPETPGDAGTLPIVRATIREVESRIDESQRDLFTELNAAVLDLGRRFGIENLESVSMNRAGHMAISKGGSSTSFSYLTGGEQLRLKIALVMGLLRLGRDHGIGRHPGLLLVDAPAGQETGDADVRAILTVLRELSEEGQQMQVILATARGVLAREVLVPERIREPGDSGYLW